MSTQHYPICIEEDYWANSQFSVARYYGGIVGDRIWDLMGGEYLDYCRRVKPIIKKRIAWYEKKLTQ